MSTDLLDQYRQASEWTCGNVAGVSDLDASTPCDEWRMRDLLNHMLETQQFFLSSARGEDASPPGPNPPELLGGNPSDDFSRTTSDVAATYGQEGVIEKTGPAIGIAFTDLLVHGWDVARATGQDATMPDGLADAAYNVVYGRFTDEQRSGLFKPEVPVSADATPQERLLGYMGRTPG